MLAMRRRMRDHGAAAVQQFGEDFLPLILLFAISVTGLMLTASYTWMKGYGYDFLAILHAITVIFTLLWLPFGKFFHIFQRPAQLGVSFYKDVGARGEQARCRRCGEAFASRMHVEDLIEVERELGYRYEMAGPATEHYQWICPRLPARDAGPRPGRALARREDRARRRRRRCAIAARSRDAEWPGLPRLRDPDLGDHRALRPASRPYSPAGSGWTPASSPTGSSRRTAASAASSAASSSRSRTTRSSASSRGRTSRSTRGCSAQGRQALPAGRAPRPAAARATRATRRRRRVPADRLRRGDRAGRRRRSSASSRRTAPTPSPCSAGRA